MRGIHGLGYALLVFAAVVVACAAPRQSNTNNLSPTPTPDLTRRPPAQNLTEAKTILNAPMDAIDIQLALDYLHAIPETAPEYKEAKRLIPAAQTKLQHYQAEAALLGKKPENSAYDGSVRCVDRYLRTALNDYHNAEYLEWSPVTRVEIKKQPYWSVRLKLRAKNAFGANIVKDVYFLIRNDQVVQAIGL